MNRLPRYKRYDLGKLPAGTTVEVVLSCINNVRLMDHANFKRYAEGKDYKAIGGRTDKSPTRLIIPMDGQWHVVVDKAGFQTLANSNVRAITPYGVIATKSAAFAAMEAEFSGDLRARPDSESIAVTRILKELSTYKQIANTDSLTGLSNRRAFDAKMAEVFHDRRNLPGTALILADIDHFKTFNDTHGHAIGDTVLRIVAETLRTTLPDNSFPARTGGEEFAIIVEGACCEEAMRIADAARRAIEATDFYDEPTRTDCGKVTISMGLCMAAMAGSVADLFHKSDLALYASKKAGRNRCTVFDASMQESAGPVTPHPRNPTQEPVIYKPRTSRISTG